MIPSKEIPSKVYHLEQRGKMSLTPGIARNVKSSKQKKVFSSRLTNNFFYKSFFNDHFPG